MLNPFKASNISIIPQNEQKKNSEDREIKEEDKANEQETEVKTPTPIIKPAEILTPIKKREIPKIEVKQDRTEAPQPQLAPIPVPAAPIGGE